LLPDWRVPREGTGHRCAWRRRLGLWQPVARTRRLENHRPPPDPADLLNAWKKQTVLAAPELLALDPIRTPLIVEHEYPRARTQDRDRLKPILQASIAFIRHIDRAAACMYALQHEVLPAQGIPVQGRGGEPYRS
jgi:hypothetical protein